MLENVAKTDIKINNLIKQRWSPRLFQSQPIEKERLLRILEAARWASSSYNEQPWRFIIGLKNGNTDSYQKIGETLDPFNRKWASKAPVLLIACGKKHFTRNNKNNPHFIYDVGQAMANLTLQATEEGLNVHQMAGFDPEKAREIFNIPDEYEAIVAAAIGYLAEDEILENNGPKERNRKTLSEICFESAWEKPLSK